MKYAPRTPNTIRVPEKILHSKRFWGKRRSRLIDQAVAVATVDNKALLRRGGSGGNRTHVLRGCQKTFYILSLPFFLKNGYGQTRLRFRTG